MSTPAPPWQPIFDSLGTLRTAWPEPEWTWDGRLECASSAFPADLVPDVRAALDAVLPGAWTHETIASSPEDVAALAKRCGGMRAGQLLLAGNGAEGMRPFALWWPWGDGSKVSVRLGVSAANRPPELTPQLRALFGVS